MKFRPYKIHPLEESLHIFGNVEAKILPQELDLFVWNIYKGNRSGWLSDLKSHGDGHELLLLQEAMLTPQGKLHGLSEFHDRHWKMASSFEYKKNQSRTGVATGSLVQATEVRVLRSEDGEFLIGTPKMILLTRYQVEGRADELLVINIHAINFVQQIVFERFIRQMLTAIESHQGPLIVAGDFNTWSAKRWLFLKSVLSGHGLKNVDFPKDSRFLKLDHIFYRQLGVVDAEILDKISSSDHLPLRAKLRF